MPRDTRIRFDYSPATTTVTAQPARWRLLPVMMLPLLGGALVYALTHHSSLDTHQEPSASAAEAAYPASLPGEKLDVIVRRNDTLDRIFRQLKLDQSDLAAILGLPGARQALSQIRPGDKLTLVHEDGTVHALNRRISETEILSVTRADSGFAAEIIATPIEFRTTHAYGTIDSSLFIALQTNWQPGSTGGPTELSPGMT